MDILINNAGTPKDASFKNMRRQDWELTLNANLNGTYKLIKAVWDGMR